MFRTIVKGTDVSGTEPKEMNNMESNSATKRFQLLPLMTLAQVTHPRLGESSPASTLSADLFQFIAELMHQDETENNLHVPYSMAPLDHLPSSGAPWRVRGSHHFVVVSDANRIEHPIAISEKECSPLDNLIIQNSQSLSFRITAQLDTLSVVGCKQLEIQLLKPVSHLELASSSSISVSLSPVAIQSLKVISICSSNSIQLEFQKLMTNMEEHEITVFTQTISTCNLVVPRPYAQSQITEVPIPEQFKVSFSSSTGQLTVVPFSP